MTNTFLAQLWNDLQHPPQSYLGGDFAFRKPDGSKYVVSSDQHMTRDSRLSTCWSLFPVSVD